MINTTYIKVHSSPVQSFMLHSNTILDVHGSSLPDKELIPWPAQREYHNVRSDYPARHHPSPCYPWSLQHCPSDHIPGHPTQHSFHQISPGVLSFETT